MTPHKITFANLYLKPGEMSVLESPTLVTTILGSCVAVTLYNRQWRIAAVSHALLPHCKRHVYQNNVNDLLHKDCAQCPEAFKYVDCSIAMMVEAFSRYGIAAAETKVQLYGGAKMIIAQRHPGSPEPIGLQNITVAQKVITDHGLTLYACDTGGVQGRKICFNTNTGNVVLHKTGRNISEDYPLNIAPQRAKAHDSK